MNFDFFHCYVYKGNQDHFLRQMLTHCSSNAESCFIFQSGYGLATMYSEVVLVRYIVPYLGEVNSMRLGLLSFTGTD